MFKSKKCNDCDTYKPLELFGLRKWKTSKGESRSGVRGYCTQCASLRTRKHRKKNPEVKYISNRDTEKQRRYATEYRKRKLKELRLREYRYRSRNRDRVTKYLRGWYTANNVRQATGTFYVCTSTNEKYSDIVKLGITSRTVDARTKYARSESTYLHSNVIIRYEMKTEYATLIENILKEELREMNKVLKERHWRASATEWYLTDHEHVSRRAAYWNSEITERGPEEVISEVWNGLPISI